MNREVTLILVLNVLFINSLFAYNSKNKCEEFLADGKPSDAILAAKALDNKYDADFCVGKVLYLQKNYKGAIESFTKSEKIAELTADQLYSILYRGISERDKNEISNSTATFKRGLETAQLGNSKYMQMEQKFLYQIGQNEIAASNYTIAIESLSKSLVIAGDDSERADSYNALSVAYFKDKQYSKSVEYCVKASNMYQKTGQLNEYADAVINLSTYHQADNHPERAISTLEELEKFAKINGGKYYEAKALMEQSLVYQKMGKESEAIARFNIGQRIATEIGAVDLLPPTN